MPNGAPRFVESSHGQSAGWLGSRFNPLTLDDDPNRGGLSSGSEPGALRLPDDLTTGRVVDRRRLLSLVNAQARRHWQCGPSRRRSIMPGVFAPDRPAIAGGIRPGTGKYPAPRDRYGRHTHGQTVLMAPADRRGSSPGDGVLAQ